MNCRHVTGRPSLQARTHPLSDYFSDTEVFVNHAGVLNDVSFCIGERINDCVTDVRAVLFDDEHWHTVERQAMDFGHLPGLHLAWQLRGHWFSPEFRAWFDGLAREDTPKPYARS